MSFDQIKDDNTKYIRLKEEDINNQEKATQKNIEDVLVYLHSFSFRFQLKVLGLATVLFLSVGIHIFTFVYVFLSPEFFSASDPSLSSIHTFLTLGLSEEEACATQFIIKAPFKSLTSEYRLFCERRYLKELGEFLLMAMASILTLFLSVIQDVLGRKKLLLVCFFLCILGFFCMVLGQSLIARLFGLMFLWSHKEIVSIAMFVLSNELLVNPIRNYGHNYYSLANCVFGILGNYLTNYIDSYMTLIQIIFGVYFLALVLVMAFIPESPSFLLKQGKLQELKKVVTQIASTNRLSPNELESALHDLDLAIECIYLYL